mgnify:CR=1 FL=1
MHLLALSAFRPVVPRVRQRLGLLVSMHLLVLSAFRLYIWITRGSVVSVSMHLLVLSAFRPPMSTRTGVTFVSQCTFWCSVLSDLTAGTVGKLVSGLNAPFGAQCFPTRRDVEGRARTPGVSMHLLVLSAFRPGRVYREACILTRLNAPFGAQCFPTRAGRASTPTARSQCTFWCSVLSDCACGTVVMTE